MADYLQVFDIWKIISEYTGRNDFSTALDTSSSDDVTWTATTSGSGDAAATTYTTNLEISWTGDDPAADPLQQAAFWTKVAIEKARAHKEAATLTISLAAERARMEIDWERDTVQRSLDETRTARARRIEAGVHDPADKEIMEAEARARAGAGTVDMEGLVDEILSIDAARAVCLAKVDGTLAVGLKAVNGFALGFAAPGGDTSAMSRLGSATDTYAAGTLKKVIFDNVSAIEAITEDCPLKRGATDSRAARTAGRLAGTLPATNIAAPTEDDKTKADEAKTAAGADLSDADALLQSAEKTLTACRAFAGLASSAGASGMAMAVTGGAVKAARRVESHARAYALADARHRETEAYAGWIAARRETAAASAPEKTVKRVIEASRAKELSRTTEARRAAQTQAEVFGVPSNIAVLSPLGNSATATTETVARLAARTSWGPAAAAASLLEAAVSAAKAHETDLTAGAAIAAGQWNASADKAADVQTAAYRYMVRARMFRAFSNAATAAEAEWESRTAKTVSNVTTINGHWAGVTEDIIAAAEAGRIDAAPAEADDPPAAGDTPVYTPSVPALGAADKTAALAALQTATAVRASARTAYAADLTAALAALAAVRASGISTHEDLVTRVATAIAAVGNLIDVTLDYLTATGHRKTAVETKAAIDAEADYNALGDAGKTSAKRIAVARTWHRVFNAQASHSRMLARGGKKAVAAARGPAGPAGPQGADGDKGDKGDTGAAGPRGATGARGQRGPQGPRGPRGQRGARTSAATADPPAPDAVAYRLPRTSPGMGVGAALTRIDQPAAEMAHTTGDPAAMTMPSVPSGLTAPASRIPSGQRLLRGADFYPVALPADDTYYAATGGGTTSDAYSKPYRACIPDITSGAYDARETAVDQDELNAVLQLKTGFRTAARTTRSALQTAQLALSAATDDTRAALTAARDNARRPAWRAYLRWAWADALHDALTAEKAAEEASAADAATKQTEAYRKWWLEAFHWLEYRATFEQLYDLRGTTIWFDTHSSLADTLPPEVS